MTGLGALFVDYLLTNKKNGQFAAVWHVALAAMLSYILQVDSYDTLGINNQHLVIGAAAHALIAVVYVVASAFGAAAPRGGHKKQQ